MTIVSEALDAEGFVLLAGAVDETSLRDMEALLGGVLGSARVSRDARGRVIGSRHLLDDAPELCRRALTAIAPLFLDALGEDLGLVRALFFDKPIGGSWALPWHQDRVVAVRDGGQSRPGGVPLVDAGDALLRQMIGVRIHMDDADEDNGALRVRPRSHRLADAAEELTVSASRGDVVLMRPLLFHASSRSRTPRARRVVHLELAPRHHLPPSLAWHHFWPLRPAPAKLAV